MAHEGRLLDTGDMFPDLVFNSVQGDKINLPADFRKTWNVFFIYRGHW
jgi:peroxiredoxin